MAIDDHPPEIILPEGFDARWEDEMTVKGFLNGVIVRSRGLRYPVYFIDPIRLQQDLAAETEMGCPYFTEPGLIVLPEVTLRAVETAVERLWGEGYFDTLKPINDEVPHPFHLVEEAQALVTSAIRLEGGDPRLLLESAIKGFEGASRLARSIDKSACILAGNSAEHLGQDERALRFYNEALRVDPLDGTASLRRGLNTFESNREAAVRDLRQAASDPSLLFPRYYLAHDAVRGGDYREGLRLCEEGLSIAEPSDVRSDLIPKVHADLLNWEASARLELGEPVELVKPILERAAELAPLDLVIRQNLGALERPDDQPWTAAGWQVGSAVDPHEASRAIQFGRTA